MNSKSILTVFLTALLFSGLILISVANIGSVQASTEVTGIISSDATWTVDGSPYSLTGPVKVNNGVTLTIDAGVTVNLNDYYLQVEGTLQARGSSSDQIRFDSGSIKFMDNSIDWDEQTGTGCIVENTIVCSEYSVAPFHVEDASPKLNNNTVGQALNSFFGSYYYAIEVWGGSPTITNSTINGPVGLLYAGSARSNSIVSDNVIVGGIVGVEISCMGTPVIERNVIMSKEGMGVYVVAHSGGRNPVLQNNTIANNRLGISVLYRVSSSLTPTITLNNFQNNEEYNFHCDPDSDAGFDACTLNATHNWWGTTDTQEISQSIYDFEDNFNLANVTFIPFLTEPNPEAPEIPTSPTPTPTPTPTPNPTPTATPSPSPIPVPGQSFFFVNSNSTVSALFFNSTSSELSFSVSGMSGTWGYVEVTISKTLVSSIQDVKVYLDGNQLNVAVTDDGDAWLLLFTYTHSTHAVLVSLAAVPEVGVESWVWIASTVVVGVLFAVAASSVFKQKRPRGNSLVV